jgi:DNA-binding transcriptional ArsR family regulator
MLEQSIVDQVFDALGDPTRRRIVERLSRGPTTVSELARPMVITLAAVVQHLQVLERCGLVRTEKVGRVRTCRVDAQGLAVAAKWIEQRRGLWDRRLDRLGAVLAESDSDPKEQP